MKLFLVTLRGAINEIEVKKSHTLGQIKDVYCKKLGISPEELILMYNSTILLEENLTISQCRFKRNDVIFVTDINELIAKERLQPILQYKAKNGLLNSNPSVMYQRGDLNDINKLNRIEEARRKSLLSNLETSLKNDSLTYKKEILLFIKCVVNNYEVLAFIDTGAESSIITKECATRINAYRLCDFRWKGSAEGVGSSNVPILGRIHFLELFIENEIMPFSFWMIERPNIELILGIDFLRKYNCVIDLQYNVLNIVLKNKITHFLVEEELPKMFKRTQSCGYCFNSKVRQRNKLKNRHKKNTIENKTN